jgi:hypothetical protein
MAAVDIKPIREVMKVVQPIIDKAGARCRLENGNGGHARLYIELNGRELFTPPGSRRGRYRLSLRRREASTISSGVRVEQTKRSISLEISRSDKFPGTSHCPTCSKLSHLVIR